MTTLTSGDASRPPCPTSVRAIAAALATQFPRKDAFVEPLDLSRVLDAGFHAGHVGSKTSYFTGIPGQILHLGSEVYGVSHPEQESILAVFHHLPQRADI